MWSSFNEHESFSDALEKVYEHTRLNKKEKKSNQQTAMAAIMDKTAKRKVNLDI